MRLSLLLALWFPAVNAMATYHEIKTYTQKNWDLDFSGQYFSSESNYLASGGVYQGLPSGGSYGLFDFNFAFRTTIPERNLALFGDTQLSYATSKSSLATRTNTGITHVMIGTDYILYQDTFTLIPEFTFLYPFSRNSVTGDAVAIGEGAMEISGKMYAQTLIKGIQAGAFTGFIYRDEGRSSLIPYGVYGEKLGKKWSFGGNLQGYASASYDKDTNNSTARTNWANTVNAGSFKFFMPNPQLLETNFWAQVKTSNNMNFMFGFGLTLNGANAANGWNVMGGVTYRISTDEGQNDHKSELERFQEETSDGVDQSLFEQQQNAKKKQRSAPVADDIDDIQSELDKTQMQIEIKKKKREK
jgi:hypothetical protein